MVEKFDQGVSSGQGSVVDPETGVLHKQNSLAHNEDELAQKQEELKQLQQELEDSKWLKNTTSDSRDVSKFSAANRFFLLLEVKKKEEGEIGS